MKEKFWVCAMLILFSGLISSISYADSTGSATQNAVTEIYVATFGRAPAYAGLAYWSDAVDSGNFSIEQVAQSFFDQPETQAKFPEGSSNAEFITTVYQNTLNRDPASEGLSYWVNALDSGAMRRDQAIISIINGAKAATGSQEDAEMFERKTEIGLYFANSSVGSLTDNENFMDWAEEIITRATDSGFTIDEAENYISGLIAELTVTGIYKDSFDFFQSLRNEKGIYRDSLRLDGNHYHPASSASIGMGLISLCIGDAMGWLENANELVVTTLQSLLGETAGFTPDRNEAGFFRHWFDMDTGIQAWDSEYSTIDTAILMCGALFAKKYFQTSEVSNYAEMLWDSIDWSVVIADPETGSIYRELLSDGSGDSDKVTFPFNEYILVAWLAKNAENEPGQATQLWTNFYESTENLPKIQYPLTDDVDESISLLTDSSSYLSHFIVQFAYYLCHPISTSSDYIGYIENALEADKLWWSSQEGAESYMYGLGAGSSISDSGYNADSIGNNPGLTVSPHIIAGFLPFYSEGKNDLTYLFENNYGVYSFTDNNIDVLWRFSLFDDSWIPGDVQGVDYALMLFGLASDSLGVDFFSTYNDFFESNEDIFP